MSTSDFNTADNVSRPSAPAAHSIKLFRNTRTGGYRAECSCGWILIGDSKEEVQGRAATHDIEWEEIADALNGAADA